MKIVFIENPAVDQPWHCQLVHDNGNVLFWSEPQNNRVDLEQMVENAQRDLPTATIEYVKK